MFNSSIIYHKILISTILQLLISEISFVSVSKHNIVQNSSFSAIVPASLFEALTFIPGF